MPRAAASKGSARVCEPAIPSSRTPRPIRKAMRRRRPQHPRQEGGFWKGGPAPPCLEDVQDGDAAEAAGGTDVDSLAGAVAEQGPAERADVRDEAGDEVALLRFDDRELGRAVLVMQADARAEPYAGI